MKNKAITLSERNTTEMPTSADQIPAWRKPRLMNEGVNLKDKETCGFTSSYSNPSKYQMTSKIVVKWVKIEMNRSFSCVYEVLRNGQ